MTKYLCDVKQIERGLTTLFSLNSPGFIEVRAIYQHEDHKPSRKFYLNSPFVSKTIADDVDQLVSRAKVNIYIGRSLRARPVGDASGIDWVRALTMDFDSALRPKESPATFAEVASVRSSLNDVDLFGYHPNMIHTGNGIQLWWRLDSEVDVRGRRKWWESICKKAEGLLNLRLDLMSVHTKQDPQFDLPRIVKLPGTWSFKGKEAPERVWRMAVFAEYDDRPIPSEKLLSLGGSDIAPPSVEQDLSVVGIPKRFWEEMQADETLHDAYLGKRFDLTDSSPSGQDWALVIRLKRKGFTPSEALAILKTSQNTKAREREDYCTTTIRKAYA